MGAINVVTCGSSDWDAICSSVSGESGEVGMVKWEADGEVVAWFECCDCEMELF